MQAPFCVLKPPSRVAKSLLLLAALIATPLFANEPAVDSMPQAQQPLSIPPETNTATETLPVTPAAELAVPPVKPKIIRSHGIAMFETPKYPANFKRFDYTSAKSQKGGTLKLHSIGTFDSFNPYIAKGNPESELSLIYDSLTTPSADEPFTEYGLIAKTIEYPADRSWVIFEINPKARFHDGVAITADDVAFTFHLLMEKGSPQYKFYYADVTAVDVLDKYRVKFSFAPKASRELPLTVGQLPVLPKHFWIDKEFNQSNLMVPLGNGPYKIDQFNPGRSITYSRVKDYWAKDLPVRQGLYNFDTITVDYYRDYTIAMEALKAGEYDVRMENVSKLWTTAYTGQAIDSGHLKKVEIKHQNPSGMQAFLFNVRRPQFKNPALRQAMALAFDFEWTNRNLFYSAYERTESFFANSELASSGLPDADELVLLEPFRHDLPASVFNQEYHAPVSSGLHNNRDNLRKAKRILDQAGYKVVDNQLLDPDSGKPVHFEMLLYDIGFKRVVNPFARALTKLGIQMDVRVVDTSQYINRTRQFNFDMLVGSISQSLSPGTEQLDYWHSSSAQTPGSRNLIGVNNLVVDMLVNKIINAQDRKSLVVACHALDRVLLHLNYVIPQWHISYHRVAYWDKFERPDVSPIYDSGYQTGLMSWWVSPEKEAALKSVRTNTTSKNKR